MKCCFIHTRAHLIIPQISAAAVYLAMRAFHRAEPYPKALARHSSYPLEAIRPLANDLVKLAQKAPTNSLNAVHKKYCQVKFMEIAKVEAPTMVLDEVENLCA